ncbi:hypothetical protein [Phosphitispora fastidiosa]|uniref:hypothetical protein n=1 Tax=Phosphitispora fastidiosa TaxID=2837202 RepID=UPI001E591826|nr:hypothetical protein [Phosphitispora fastidiosa]MBU7006178.1 hypothetical protein [Phosphitispora fastidiosa]
MNTTITSILSVKVASWNNQCGHRNTSLFLADAFAPKPIPQHAPLEMSFWYDITNLYALLMDCMPYFLRSSDYYQNFHLKPCCDMAPTRSLLEIMKDCQVINENEVRNTKVFINAIREIRSCFCHNKPMLSFNQYKVNQGIGTHSQNWAVFPHLRTNSEALFDYKEAYRLLFSESRKVFALLDRAVNQMCESATEDDIYSWSQSIAAWYLGSSDIISRCLVSYYHSKSFKSKMGYQLREWNKCLSVNSLIEIARLQGMTIEEFICKYLNELTDTIYDYHKVATPEQVLPFFFNDIL